MNSGKSLSGGSGVLCKYTTCVNFVTMDESWIDHYDVETKM